MPVPRTILWDRDPHTAAKHRLLKRYLQAWYPILLQHGRDQLAYAEGFAGPGIYRGGEPGSPVIALEVFLAQQQLLGERLLDMVLIEEHSSRLAQLKREMDKALVRCGTPPPGLRIHYSGQDHATALLPTLRQISAMDAPVFAFLDSFGGPDVPLDIARAIAAAPASEVLVTFGTSFLTRAGAVEDHQATGDQVSGGRTWRGVLDQPSHLKKPFLVNTYRDSLKAAGFLFVVSFEMLDEGGNDLHLVFGTTHPKGVVKMKDAMWRVDPIQGVRYRDPRDPDQIAFELATQPSMGPLRRALIAELQHGERTVAELKDHTLLETVYRPPHVTPVLRQLADQEIIEREPRRGQLTGQTRIRLASQPRLF